MARPIFRESALRRYNERLEKVELPRYATASWALLAWAGALLFLLFAALLMAVRLPEYVEGPGIVLRHEGGGNAGSVVAVLLPIGAANRVTSGQAAEIDLPGLFAENGVPLRAEVIAVEPEPLSPAAARARYDLDAAVGGQINGPVIVAAVAVDLPPDLWLGSVGRGRIVTGSRSILSLLPGLVADETGVGGGE